MEFKKKKKHPELGLSVNEALEICKKKFIPNVTFNNGNVLNRKDQSDSTIKSISFFELVDNSVKMTFTNHINGNNRYTMWKDDKFADIIP